MLIFDKVHRLDDPSLVLKILADEHPRIRVLATGSSTLAATRKFRDSLTGRKHSIHLQPVLWEKCAAWLGAPDSDRRLSHGGLPKAHLDNARPAAIAAFRKIYAAGSSSIVDPGVKRPFAVILSGHRFTVCDTGALGRLVEGAESFK